MVTRSGAPEGGNLRIEPHELRSARRYLKKDLRRAAALCPLPDPVCSKRCRDYNPAVRCNGSCPAAAHELSSDPANPIEPQIVALVFELKRTGVFHPCWSCEGHNDQDGHLQKIPRVWFYARSVVHLRALSETIQRLVNARYLSTRWHVVLTYSDPQNPNTTFSLEPADTSDDLAGLQQDAGAIAQAIQQSFRDTCGRLRSLYT